MILVTIDEFSEEQLHRMTALNPKRVTRLEPDITNSKRSLEQTEIWITYGFDVTKENLDQMPELKWIQVFQAGIEHIPIDELDKRNIRLTNIKGIHGSPMSEYVMSIILYVTRNMARFFRDQKKHIWNRENLVDEACGKTMAIFGAGSIGIAVAEKAKAFGMHVIGINTSGKKKSPFDEMVTLSEKHNVLRKSDFVVLLLPVTEATYHCVGHKEFQQMKSTAWLINIGRGKLVDTDALMAAVRKKTFAGAALDVFEEDPLPEDHPLWDTDNVLITPHLSAKTVHYLDRCIDKFKSNLEFYENSKWMPYQVDVKKGY